MTGPSRPWRIAVVAWAAVITASGLLPTRSTVQAISGGRDGTVTTAGHFAAYILLGFLLAAALGGRQVRVRELLVGFTLATALGGAIELIQAPLPYRDAQASDFVVDVAGAVLGLALFSGVVWVTRSRWRRG